MNIVFVSPYCGKTNGIISYYKSVLDLISDNRRLNIEVINNNKNLNFDVFSKNIFKLISTKYEIENTIIEFPEAKATSIFFEKGYKTHLRMHCPTYVAQKYDGKEINNNFYARELFAILNASYTSSPSIGLLREVNNIINTKHIDYFMNPCPSIQLSTSDDKEYDIIIMTRFQKLKGVDWIVPILKNLPSFISVLVIGFDISKALQKENIRCKVKNFDFIDGPERFEYIKKSKIMLVLSRFENCSMTILEAISCGTEVICWNVGGNSEFSPYIVHTARAFDVSEISNKIIEKIKNYNFNRRYFIQEKNRINNDFISGFNRMLYKITNYSYHKNIYSIPPCPKLPTALESYKNKKILGISISNEHIEELWHPIIKKLGVQYRYICKRPLGFHSIFPEAKEEVNKRYYAHYDWTISTKRLFNNIKSFAPDVILFHNGSHPAYTDVLNKIKETNIPIIFSELGWFPQKNNIYFDELGTNGDSILSKYNFDEISGTIKTEIDKTITGKYNVIITQLDYDTNIMVHSHRFKNMISLIEYITTSLPDEKFIIKTHPLDNKKDRFTMFKSDRIKIIHKCNLDLLLSRAKGVFGINSTVLLEALKYDTNVYFFGKGILSNKEVAIDCSHNDLKDIYTNKLYCNKSDRYTIIDFLKQRQINVAQVRDMDIETFYQNKSIKLLITQLNKTNIAHSITNITPPTNSITTLKKNHRKSFLLHLTEQYIAIFDPQKLNKLKRDYNIFFKDSKKKISKIVYTLIKKGY